MKRYRFLINALTLLVMIFFSIAAFAAQNAPKRLPTHRPLPITSETDSILYADISKDGKWMVYTAGAANYGDLWLRSVDSGNLILPRKLTNDPSSEYAPAFSPDGKSIAFVGTAHDVKGDIYLLKLDPDRRPLSEAIRLTGRETEDESPCFSADGNRLYFHQNKPGDTARSIVFLDFTSDAKTVQSIDTHGDAAFPSVSPDGSKLLFISYRLHSDGDVFMMDMVTNTVMPLTNDEKMDFYPSWSSDGQYALISRFGADTNRDGSITPADNASIYRIRITDPEHLAYPLTSAGASGFQARSAGSSLYFLSSQGGVTNCRMLPVEGEIPVLDTLQAQFALAEEVERTLPFDPHLTILGYYRVVERCIPQPAEHSDFGARAAYKIGMIYKQLGMNIASRQAFQLIPAHFPDARPMASLAQIQDIILHHDALLKSAIDEFQRRAIIEKTIHELKAFEQNASPQVRARSKIEQGRILAETAEDPEAFMEALSQFDSVIQTHPSERPECAEAMILKADVYSRIGQAEMVRPAYLAVIKNYPDIQAFSDLAVERILEMETREFSDPSSETMPQQVARLRQIAQENRQHHPLLSAGALNRVGDVYFSADEWSSAKNAYQEVLNEFKESTSRTTAAARLSLAEILYREERFRDALDLYETEIGLRPYDDEIYNLARAGYIRKSIAAGEYQYRLNEIYAARKTFKLLMDYDDAIIEAHRGYIKCAAVLNDMPSVLQSYERRLAKNPQDATALYGKALSLTYLEDRESLKHARSLLVQAIALNGWSEYFHQTLGYVLEVLETVHQEKGMLEPALESYNKAYFLNDHANNPDNASNLLLNIGNIYYLLNQFGKAFEYYSMRLESDRPFDNRNTEILFYRRLGGSAFQSGEKPETIRAFEKAIQLIDAHSDPKEASGVFDRISRFVLDYMLFPMIDASYKEKTVDALAKSQSEINQKLAHLTSERMVVPSSEWKAYRSGLEALLTPQEKLNSDVLTAYGDFLKTQNQPIRPDQVEAQQTLTALIARAKESLAFPERLIQLKAELLDRLGLAYQDSEKWEDAIRMFREVFSLNQQLGLVKNLARNKRSIAYNTYYYAGTLSGEARKKQLASAANDFAEVIRLIDEYGVPEKERAVGSGLVSIEMQVSLDETSATQAAYGFTADQEKRLAEAFRSRIFIELGELSISEQAIQQQVALYPPEKSVEDRDVYGVSLLFHRAGHLAHALGKFPDAAERFQRSADFSLQLQNPVSTAINVANMASLTSRYSLPIHIELYDKQASQLLSRHLNVIDGTFAAGYHNRMGVYLAAIEKPNVSVLEGASEETHRLSSSGTHFLQGIRILEKDKGKYSRRESELLATLHLNLAWLASYFSDHQQAAAHYQKALDLSVQGILPNLEWRARLGLGQSDPALDVLKSVTFLRAGCGAGEILGGFSERIAELTDQGKIESAFNLAEYLSEIERYHRLAPLVLTMSEPEKTLVKAIYPRLERIRNIRQEIESSEGEERHYLRQQLDQEVSLYQDQVGKSNDLLPDFIRFFKNSHQAEQAIILMGLAVHAEDAAGNDPAQYQAWVSKYHDLRQKMMSTRSKDASADLFRFFSPEPANAMDVIEAMPENTTIYRIIRARNKYLVMKISREDASVTWIERLNAIPLTGTGTEYIAYEHPQDLPKMLKAVRVLSATHYLRSYQQRQPYFSDSLSVTDDACYAPVTDQMLLSETCAHPSDVMGLKNPVARAFSVPTRQGEYSESFMAVYAGNDRHIRLERLLAQFPELALTVLLQGHPDDAYTLGHLFSHYRIPTLIMPLDSDNHSAFIDPFSKIYKEYSAYEAMQFADQSLAQKGDEPDFMLIGFAGMAPAEASAFSEKKFVQYVKDARSAFESGDFSGALTLFDRAVRIARQVKKFEPLLPDLYRFGRDSAYETGDLDKSLAFSKSLVDWMAAKKPDSEGHADALIWYGLIHSKKEQFDQAVPALENALEMLGNLELKPAQVRALSELGAVLENATDYDRALDRFQTAAEISEFIDKKELLAKQYANIGKIYDLRMSQYAQGMKYYARALSVYRGLEQHDGISQALLDMGRCYRLMGNFSEADRHYREAMEIAKKDSKNIELQAKIMIEQANNAWFQARYQEAFELQRKVREIALANDLTGIEVMSQNTSGLIWWTLGDPPKALKELEIALKSARKIKHREDEVATTLNNIGLVYREMEAYDTALKYFDDAMEIDTRIKSRWALAYDFRNKAITLLRMNLAVEAAPLFISAKDEAHAIGNRINEAKAWLGLGETYLKLKDREHAENAFQQALELSRSMSLKETEWRALHGMAALRISSNDPFAAEKLLREAVAIIETMRADIKIEQLRDSFIVNKLDVYKMLVLLLANMNRPEDAFEIAERSRSRNFIDILGNQRLALGTEIEQQLYDRQQTLRSRIAENQALLSQAAAAKEQDVYRAAIEKLQGEFQDVMIEIQAKNPQLASLVSVEPIRMNQVRERLEPGVAMLAYYLLPDELLCWVIKSDSVRLHRSPMNPSESQLGQTILDYRRMIQNLEPIEPLSKTLYNTLIQPVAQDITDTRILGIIPHGPLHYLSFATLTDGKDYLIDRFALFYLPSVSVFDYTLKRRFKDKQLDVLAIGNPDLADPALALPFSEYEVGSIQWNFPKITILTQERATKSWVVKNIDRFGIIHLASHGEFDPINPLFSALKLTKGEAFTGDLQATEVFGLKINADMVVLSACQTGLGKVTGGDDVIGLNRAFFYAGTHTIISSLWRVSDISTAMLIKHFYRQYILHEKGDSLRQAILHVKNQYPHPAYWGAFTLVGDYF